jgi:SAM-dependent methyltransferase
MSEATTSSGYVVDVPYPRSFIPQIVPETLRLVAALNGHTQPPDEEFAYCDLGCGAADTLLCLADANPRARFVGVDVSPLHIPEAQRRAEAGGLENLTLLQCNFAEAEARELSAFDFIVAHGIWTWVSPAVRQAALSFVRKRLKPGGLFYVSYNALPGWAAIAPLRRFMREQTSDRAGKESPLERAKRAVDLMQRLADGGAAYFRAHPTAASMLTLMRERGPAYVVHEYFHDDWELYYFADVARELAGSDLTFLGQVPLHLNVRDLAASPTVKKLADGPVQRPVFEAWKDFADNTLFRSDVFVRGALMRDPSETRYYFEGTPFGTLAPAAQVKREAKLGSYTVEYKGATYDAVLEAIAKRPMTAMELALLPELAELGQLRVGDLLQNLVLGGQVVPMRPGDPKTAVPDSGPYKLASRYNEIALADALSGDGPLVLSSPVTRSAVHVSLLEALCIRLSTDPSLPPAGYAEAVKAYARSRPMPLVLGERKVKDGDELAKVMQREIDRFRAGTMRRLVSLGVLSPR